jgi:hypothetical protein
MPVAQANQLAAINHPRSCTISPTSIPPATSTVAMLLKEGIRAARFLFPENGPTRHVETWRPPRVTDPRVLAEVRTRLGEVNVALDPAPSGDLLSRIIVLLAHYRTTEHSKSTEYGIALDWADDLGEYPMWAIDHAARTWRRTKRFRPQICEMIELCEEACGKLKTERSRLQSIVEASELASNPTCQEMASLVQSIVQPLTSSARKLSSTPYGRTETPEQASTNRAAKLRAPGGADQPSSIRRLSYPSHQPLANSPPTHESRSEPCAPVSRTGPAALAMERAPGQDPTIDTANRLAATAPGLHGEPCQRHGTLIRR